MKCVCIYIWHGMPVRESIYTALIMWIWTNSCIPCEGAVWVTVGGRLLAYHTFHIAWERGNIIMLSSSLSYHSYSVYMSHAYIELHRKWKAAEKASAAQPGLHVAVCILSCHHALLSTLINQPLSIMACKLLSHCEKAFYINTYIYMSVNEKPLFLLYILLSRKEKGSS